MEMEDFSFFPKFSYNFLGYFGLFFCLFFSSTVVGSVRVFFFCLKQGKNEGWNTKITIIRVLQRKRRRFGPFFGYKTTSFWMPPKFFLKSHAHPKTTSFEITIVQNIIVLDMF